MKVPTEEAAVFNTELPHELQLPQLQPDYNEETATVTDWVITDNHFNPLTAILMQSLLTIEVSVLTAIFQEDLG